MQSSLARFYFASGHSKKRDRATAQIGEQVEARNLQVMVCHPGENGPQKYQK
jgi:hypothetical protein